MNKQNDIGFIALSENHKVVELLMSYLEIEGYTTSPYIIDSECELETASTSSNLSSAYYFINKQCHYLVLLMSSAFLKHSFAMQLYGMSCTSREESSRRKLIILEMAPLPVAITNGQITLSAAKYASYQIACEIKKVIEARPKSEKQSNNRSNINIVRADVINNSKFF